MLIFVWVVFAVLVGFFARSKGKSLILWTLLSMLLSPLIGFIIVAVLGNAKEAERRHRELLDAVKSGQADARTLEQLKIRS